MPRPTALAIFVTVVGASLVFLLVGRTEGDAPATSTTISPGTVDANATVEFVIDGDTIDAIIEAPGGPTEERIRLIGIDTPETKRPDTPIECFGPEATEFVERLLPVGTPIRVERDVVARDDFGRLLGYVYRADDGLFVNHEVIRRGYGTPLSIEPNTTHRELMVDAARAAETDDLGLWVACSG
ncbi:MAG: thermonuclease family protein [Actinomycetota bacterium]